MIHADPIPDPDVSPDIAAEIDNFVAEMTRFRRGEISDERFKAFRLAHGIYGQRQEGVQMIRVKIPAGILNARQVVRLADIAEEFSTGIAHLTTRQDVQFHYVPLESVPKILRILAEVGLTTREACGNSVRNVTACPLTGSIADELFDVRPYAEAVAEFLMRNSFCQQMARKFKVALSSCPEDCASTGIHDIGLTARIEASTGRPGFRVIVGGGLGNTPFVARELQPFVGLDELLPLTRAIIKVFNRHANRRNKMRARLKYVVHNLGIDEFREQANAALADLSPLEIAESDIRRYVPVALRPVFDDHIAGRIRPASLPSPPAPIPGDAPGVSSDDPAFADWCAAGLARTGMRREPS